MLGEPAKPLISAWPAHLPPHGRGKQAALSGKQPAAACAARECGVQNPCTGALNTCRHDAQTQHNALLTALCVLCCQLQCLPAGAADTAELLFKRWRFAARASAAAAAAACCAATAARMPA